MGKIIFGTGRDPFRAELSDELIKKAVEISNHLKELHSQYGDDCTFEAYLAVPDIKSLADLEYRHHSEELVLEMKTYPFLFTQDETEEDLKARGLTSFLSHSIALSYSGHDGFENVEYIDIRDMSDISVTSTLAYKLHDSVERPDGIHRDLLGDVISKLTRSIEEQQIIGNAVTLWREKIKEESSEE